MNVSGPLYYPILYVNEVSIIIIIHTWQSQCDVLYSTTLSRYNINNYYIYLYGEVMFFTMQYPPP